MAKVKKIKQTNSSISPFLKSKRLTLLKSIRRKGRYDVYKVKRKGRPLLLKVAKDRTTSLRLRNENLWSRQVAPKIPSDAPFIIPRPVDYGFIDRQYFWLLSEFVGGEPFAKVRGVVTEIQVKPPKPYLDKVAEMIFVLQKLEAKGLTGIDERFGKAPKTDKLSILRTAISFGGNTAPYLAELLQIIDKNYKNLGWSTNHCDITEINLLMRDDKIVLMDAELGDTAGFRFYDVAEFYNRLYTRSRRPDLAKVFLKAFIKRLRKSQIRKFLNNFVCLCALRCIGNFKEIESIQKEKRTERVRFARRFAQDIISYKIIDL